MPGGRLYPARFAAGIGKEVEETSELYEGARDELSQRPRTPFWPAPKREF